jgi:catechol 2,3-dioxygenase-like lactoylglutathione lyase family enzyme
MIEGLSHMTFIVHDLDRMTDILQGVFDAKQVYASGKRQFSLSPERFFVIGGLWIAIMEGEALSERTYNHIAFKVPDGTLDLYLDRIERLGLDVRLPRPRVEGEGRSLYFHDDDNHLFELHSGALDGRLASYARLEAVNE